MSNNNSAVPAPDLVAANLSTAREKVLEHRLVSDLAVLMLQRGITLDVLRSEFDAQGHDVVLDAAGVIRHVQLKATVDGGKRRDVDINVRLRSKPSGCVVWMTYDPSTLAITGYRWLGEEPGEPLPELGNRVTRHSKGDSSGSKSQRPALRNVGLGRFDKLFGLDDLADRLFGPARSEATSLVLSQLRRRHGTGWRVAVAGAMQRQSFADCVELAHLVDGYGVLEQLCELDPPRWLERSRSGQHDHDVGLLWTRLFLEHRRWRFASPAEPVDEELVRLDHLAGTLLAAIERELLS